MSTEATTLNELTPGQAGVVQAIDSGHPGVVRLMVLGVVEGVSVRVRSKAIGGDPVEVEVHGTAISVRREQGRHFLIARLPESG